MCGIGDYTGFLTRKSPVRRWGVLSFDLEKYGVPLTTDREVAVNRVWYGIPDRHSFSAGVIMQGLRELGAIKEEAVLWFQHEFGIWPHNTRFIAMLKNLDVPKVVSFHTLHFQSSETPSGLRREQWALLSMLLPYVDAITVFSHGVYNAVTTAFPEHSFKIYVLKHGIHSYPEVSHLSRKEAKEKLSDFLLYDSNLNQETRELLHRHRVFLDPDTVLIGQTGFLCPAKGSELLYTARDSLQKSIPHKRIVALRIGSSRDESQSLYAEELRRQQNGRPNFLLETWLPQSMLPVAQRAFDINFYWPLECTQSGVLAHALGAGAIVAGRDLEGVGETLKEAGEPVDTNLGGLLVKIQDVMTNPELALRIEERALAYAAEYSWDNQARRHFELAEHILAPAPVLEAPPLLLTEATPDISVTTRIEFGVPA